MKGISSPQNLFDEALAPSNSRIPMNHYREGVPKDADVVCSQRQLSTNSSSHKFNIHRHLSCHFCDFKTYRVDLLTAHAILHTQRNQTQHSVLQCRNAQQKLNDHVGINENEDLCCDLCDFRSNETVTLSKHVKLHEDQDSVSCDVCGYRTDDIEDLKRHLLCHCSDRIYYCDKCDYKTNRIENLNKHSIKNCKMFSCNLCDYKTYGESRLAKHVTAHTEELCCDHCEFKCDGLEKFRNHLWKHNDNVISNHQSMFPYKCTLCSYEAKSLDVLNRHMKLHVDDTCEVSPVCDYRAKIRSDLNGYTLVHESDFQVVSMYWCKICYFKTNKGEEFDKHVKTCCRTDNMPKINNNRTR